MARIKVSTIIDATPEEVWAAVDDVRDHPEWMEDAVAVRITSGGGRQGVGTTFDCETKIGPIRLVDKMAITEWVPGKVMGVRHVGLVAGTGRFTIRPARRGRTRFGWEEKLRFPWWMGGPAGGVVGKRVLRRIWRRNLRNLRALVEGG